MPDNPIGTKKDFSKNISNSHMKSCLTIRGLMDVTSLERMDINYKEENEFLQTHKQLQYKNENEIYAISR